MTAPDEGQAALERCDPIPCPACASQKTNWQCPACCERYAAACRDGTGPNDINNRPFLPKCGPKGAYGTL